MTDTQKFLGMTIEGKIFKPHSRAPQRSLEDFQLMIQNVLHVSEVQGIGWDQYTPYFNDGEPCVFSTKEVYISVEGTTTIEYEEFGDEDDGFIWLSHYDNEFERLIGDASRQWNKEGWSYKNDPLNAPNPTLFYHFTQLTEAMGNGSFNDVLLDTFGDHARIIINKARGTVEIEEWEHN